MFLHSKWYTEEFPDYNMWLPRYKNTKQLLNSFLKSNYGTIASYGKQYF